MPTFTLKEEQRKSIEAVYKGSSVFVWLPTGFGKSICYQALPFVIEHKKGQRGSCAVLVVSPSVSLMIDQVESLRARHQLLLLEVISPHLLWLQNLLSLQTTCCFVLLRHGFTEVEGCTRE